MIEPGTQHLVRMVRGVDDIDPQDFYLLQIATNAWNRKIIRAGLIHDDI